MRRNLFIYIGDSVEPKGDYWSVHRLASRGGTSRWSSLKTARPGDRVLIYIQRPHSALVAKAEVLTDPVRGEPGDWQYVVKLGNFELLPNRVGLCDLKIAFPKWNWLRYPRKGATVPEAFEAPLWSLVHKKQSGVQILISNSDHGLQLLKSMSASTQSFYWSAPKLTGAGDKVLFYVEKPLSAIVAIGEALSGARATERKWYEARIGKIRMLESPIELHELRDMFPDWAWLRSVNMFAYVSPERAKALLERAKLTPEIAKGRPDPKAEGPQVLEGIIHETTVLSRWRSGALRKTALANAKGTCAACAVVFSDLLDGRGARVLQVHHRRQLALQDVPKVTKLKDLAVVCANCHALIHMDPKRALAVERLRTLLAVRPRNS